MIVVRFMMISLTHTRFSSSSLYLRQKQVQLYVAFLSFQRSGKLNYTKALQMTSYLQAEEEYVPWAAAIKNFNFIKSLLTQTRPAYKHLQVGLKLRMF